MSAAPILRPVRAWRTAAATGILLLAGACAPLEPAPTAPPSPVYDLLIQNGRIIDGTGSPWYRGDVATSGDRIAAVGRLPGAEARDTLDARGMVVAPGFIDVLGHSERRLLRDGRAISKITQGITSEVTGEVSSVVPVIREPADGEEDEESEERAWTDLDGYFRVLEGQGTAINLGTMVTVGTVRRAVMAMVDRPATPEELREMERHVEDAMRQGAMGLSAGLIYAPASFAPTAEIVALARAAGRHGGVYRSHIRSEGDRLLEAVAEAIHVGEEAGVPVHIHHLKATGPDNWGKVGDAVRLIQEARERGVEVTADVYPYPAAGTGLRHTLPQWAHEGGRTALVERIRDPEQRARLRRELLAGEGGDWWIGTAVPGPEAILIASVGADTLRHFEGMRLSEVAEAMGRDPVDALLDLLDEDRGRTSAVYFAMDEDDVRTGLVQPWTSIGVDGGARAADETVTDSPHPRVYGTFPRIFRKYVREEGLLTLEDAVRKSTALAAQTSGLDDRGVLKAGLVADIVVFDPERIADRATFEDPVQTAVGIEHVLVNGVPVMRNGSPTGELPGRGLRGRGGE
jgi:N-acyl-D-amino-acid deacylase